MNVCNQSNKLDVFIKMDCKIINDNRQHMEVNKNIAISILNDETKEDDSNTCKFNCKVKSLCELNENKGIIVCSFIPIGVTQLRTVNLTKSKLTNIPETISQLNNLVRLDLSHNYLRCLPKAFNKLIKLRSLNLSYNCFSVTPECLTEGYLGALSYLNISHNYLKTFSVLERSLQLLKSIDLSGNRLESIPDWLTRNPYNVVECLDLSNNGCEILRLLVNNEVLEDIKFMKNSLSQTLRSLRLSKCSLNKRNIFSLSAFTSISVLNLSNDSMYRLKEMNNVLCDISFSALPNHANITELYLSNVFLHAISEDIKNFINLKVLDVSQNELMNLPESMCSLKKLKWCNASCNSLIKLPQTFGNLKSLEKVYLSSNQLSCLPESMIELSQLEVLDLYNNLFDRAPELIWRLNLKECDMFYNLFELTSISEGYTVDNVCKYLKLWNEFIKNTPDACSRHQCQRPSDSENDLENDSSRSGSSEAVSLQKMYASDEDSEEEFRCSDKNRCNFSSYVENGNNVEKEDADQEDWDKEYDSDEYFDPTKVGALKNVVIKVPILSCNFQTFIGRVDTNAYNPSDYHPKCISSRRKNAVFEKSVQGQFDDA